MVGTSAGAAIAVDLAVHHPQLVSVVVAHEFPWRYTRHLPAASQVTALLKIETYALAGAALVADPADYVLAASAGALLLIGYVAAFVAGGSLAVARRDVT